MLISSRRDFLKVCYCQDFILNLKCILTLKFFSILEYKKNYNRTPTSCIKQLVDLATNEDRDFAKELLDYNSIDIKIFKTFVDMALPAMSKSCFINNMSCYCLSNEVTAAEETFAILAFENSVQRWVFMIEKAIHLDNYDEQDGDQHRSRFRGNLPNLKYQRNIKPRSDGKATAGVWTEKAKERFNEICSMVQDKRKERIAFENALKEMYIGDANNSSYGSQNKRRRLDDDGDNEGGKKSKVKVVNLFELIEL